MGSSALLDCPSLEELRPDVLRAVNDSPDSDVIGLNGVEDQVRLKTKTPVPRRQVVGDLTDERKIGKQPQRPDEASLIGISLIRAKFAFGKLVNVDEVGAGTLRKSVLSHGGARQPVAGQRREYRRECPW
jgi:hypothetical protein